MSASRYVKVGEEEDEGFATEKPRSSRHTWLRPTLLISLGALLGAAVLALILFGFHSRLCLNETCAEHLSAYHPPILDDVGIRFEKQRFNPGSRHPSAYQSPGGPDSEVDQTWQALGTEYARITLSPEAGKAAGLEGHIRVPGSDDYIGFVEVLHQLHCLDMVRKAVFYNYDFYKQEGKHPFHADEEFLRFHVSHCIETVRQVLICQADFNLFGKRVAAPTQVTQIVFLRIACILMLAIASYVPTADAKQKNFAYLSCYVWVDKAYRDNHLFPDYATNHVCRNFDDIRIWATQRQDPRLANFSQVEEALERRPEDIVLPETP